ncbi:tight adherence protein B [Antricoccus suffuscus]|uniref:Tight adherence protein B n=1 Tax=Antricoccus suffuscus TaxID=1629062 RepID=A0A2T0ZXK7_9ACTN|nr:type II secretion system F family protein [Antricoccus suffuscus]PRZ41095.1 tight adherence protein B [Antricoccus suffuscus]
MGEFLGLLGGVGLLLVMYSATRRPARAVRRQSGLTVRRNQLLTDAGLAGVSSAQLWLIQGVCALFAGIVILLLTAAVAISAIFAVFGFFVPDMLVRRLHEKRRADLREVWPEAADHLASAVRAGLSIPEALSALSTRGPEPLRAAFAQFGADYRASGRFVDCLDMLKARLADPVGDRICETLRVTREVGGTELGTVLRTLSQFLREDARVRAELDSRKQTTVNGARLAVAAPWLVLLLLGTQSTTLQAYDTPLGLAVLIGGAVVCVLAYRLMVRIGRLPSEQRVLR